MSVLSAQTIRFRCRSRMKQLIDPFHERTVVNGKTFGLSSCGYDIRASVPEKPIRTVLLMPGEFVLLSSVEKIHMPRDLVAIVHDKSSWARRGLALQNTVLEPGWYGHITLELSNHGRQILHIPHADPIAQLMFHLLDEPTEQPYNGKYQDQPDRAVEAIDETSDN